MGTNVFMTKEKVNGVKHKGGKGTIEKIRNKDSRPIREENAQWDSQKTE